MIKYKNARKQIWLQVVFWSPCQEPHRSCLSARSSFWLIDWLGSSAFGLNQYPLVLNWSTSATFLVKSRLSTGMYWHWHWASSTVLVSAPSPPAGSTPKAQPPAAADAASVETNVCKIWVLTTSTHRNNILKENSRNVECCNNFCGLKQWLSEAIASI